MPEESTDAEYRMAACTEANRGANASGVQDWNPGLKPRPMRIRGYSLSVGQRRTRAMLPKWEPTIRSNRLTIPAWHKPYGEALLETDHGILAKLLAATEIAVFERLLELAATKDAPEERRDIRRAIDVILTLKAGKTQVGSKISPVELAEVGLKRNCGNEVRVGTTQVPSVSTPRDSVRHAQAGENEQNTRVDNGELSHGK